MSPKLEGGYPFPTVVSRDSTHSPKLNLKGLYRGRSPVLPPNCGFRVSNPGLDPVTIILLFSLFIDSL